MINNSYQWWQTGVIYQVYPRSFQDSNGDGIGDLAGITQRLDYLSETLGIDAVWLSPFYPSPMADFGYDVSDYCNVDPMFGTLADFDLLVTEAHKRNLHIIIDFVPNHTSDQHPWFLESRSSLDNPKRDWYIWRSPKVDGSLPNNWQSHFGGSAWEWEPVTSQYYLHSFLKEQPDLNWRNPALKAAMLGVIRFWLERGVDGFRLDVAHYIGKDIDLRDNPWIPGINLEEHKDHLYMAQNHLYDKGDPYAHEVFREFRQLLDSYSSERPRYSVGEIHIFEWNQWVKYYGTNLDELHMPFNFALMVAPWQPQALRMVVDNLEAVLPVGAWPNYVLGNHDTPRLASRYGKENVRLADLLLLTLKGTPTLYQGEELGMENVDIPYEKQKDPYGLNVPGFGRDLCRTPMQWDASPTAGFSSAPLERLWLPLADNYKEVNIQNQTNQMGSVLAFYRQLIKLRKTSAALQWGDYRPIDGVPTSCYVYLRLTEDQEYLIALNFSDHPVKLNLSAFVIGNLLISTELDRHGSVDLSQLELRGYEGVVISRT